jgi:hypothetical protein
LGVFGRFGADLGPIWPIWPIWGRSGADLGPIWGRSGRSGADLGRQPDRSTIVSRSGGQLSRCAAKTTTKQVGIARRVLRPHFARPPRLEASSNKPATGDGFTIAGPHGPAPPQQTLCGLRGLFARQSRHTVATAPLKWRGCPSFGQSVRPASPLRCARGIAPVARGLLPRGSAAPFGCAAGAFYCYPLSR